MENSLYIALSRRRALERQMDVVANNLANMNTPSYKAERLVFQEYLVPTKARAPGLSYVQDIGQYRVLDDGPMRQTGNQLDVAISGDGYFVVDTPLGERYSRHGRFQLDTNGNLTNSSGNPILGAGGPINIPPGESQISISGDGVVSGENGELGTLRIVTFDDLTGLRKAADGLYTATEDPQDVESPQLVQGSLEGSNVQAVLELTNMIEIQRRHASLKRFIDQEDRRQRDMIDKLSRVSA